jgi:hypothetical protein
MRRATREPIQTRTATTTGAGHGDRLVDVGERVHPDPLEGNEQEDQGRDTTEEAAQDDHLFKSTPGKAASASLARG